MVRSKTQELHMQGYAHLAQEERYHIELMRREGVSIRRIAEGMNRSPSTVSRKLRRNARQRGHRHRQAEGKACGSAGRSSRSASG